jgi:hypothetical protein
MERDPLKPANAKRRKGVLILEPTELALYGGAATVEPAGSRSRRRTTIPNRT